MLCLGRAGPPGLVRVVDNMSMLFLDSVSARIFYLPGMCIAVNQKLNFAAKKTRRQMRCIMCSSLLHIDLVTFTTAYYLLRTGTFGLYHHFRELFYTFPFLSGNYSSFSLLQGICYYPQGVHSAFLNIQGSN